MGESAGEGGNLEGVRANAGIVELLRCLVVTMNTQLEKKEEKERWQCSCAANFKKSGVIISIQMTALCHSIRNQS